MRIVITGGAGFIGSHLAERLLENGDEVVCLDNFNDFYDPNIKQQNIERALSYRRYTLVTGDILDTELLEQVFNDPFDAVVHLAAYAGVRPSIERPGTYQRVNIEGTVNLLEQCRIHNVSKFIFASSSSVYGGRTDVPFREVDKVFQPISPYAATKLAGEAFCHTYHHLFGTNVHALRLFTVYGPRQRPEMAIHLFASHMLRGEPLPLFGNGLSSRNYTYVDDIIDGIEASIKHCEGYKIINLGGANTTTLHDLVALVGKRLGVTPSIDRSPNQPGDVHVTCADLERAEKILGYVPKTDISTGIDKFCSWLESKRSKKVWEEEFSDAVSE